MLLEGKTALVTGASQGIGKEIARILNKNGAKIYIVARSADKLSTTAKELDPTGKEVFAVPCDITSNTAVEEVFKRFKADGISIDIWLTQQALLTQILLKLLILSFGIKF